MPRITMVNDERNLLTAFRMTFETEGYDVETFHDPMEALPHLICQPPDVLVLNGRMPCMHGIEFFKRFRRYSRAPMIIYSASADDIEEQLEADGCPADAYVFPVAMRSLLALAHNMLSVRSPRVAKYKR